MNGGPISCGKKQAQKKAFVRFQILTGVGFAAFVYFPFLSSHDEQVFTLLVKIEATAARQASKTGFIIGLITVAGYQL